MKTLEKANVSIHIDSQTQAEAALLFAQMGLDQETAIEMFFRQVIAERRLPFKLKPSQTLGDRVFELARLANAPIVNLESNDNGVIVLDENVPKHIADWAKNG
jgi:addiction module RelB/DinJ family antitoxin